VASGSCQLTAAKWANRRSLGIAADSAGACQVVPRRITGIVRKTWPPSATTGEPGQPGLHPATALTSTGGANVEHGIAPNLPEGQRGASYCTAPSSGFSVSAAQSLLLTVLGVKGSQVRILSSRRHDGEFPQVRALIHASESGP
jgi:hypothetical protein